MGVAVAVVAAAGLVVSGVGLTYDEKDVEADEAACVDAETSEHVG